MAQKQLNHCFNYTLSNPKGRKKRKKKSNVFKKRRRRRKKSLLRTLF